MVVKCAIAQAAQAVSATATRAMMLNLASPWQRRSSSVASLPNKSEQPEMSSHRPSVPLIATQGVKRVAQSASLAKAWASAAGFSVAILSAGTKARASAKVMVG